MTSEQTTWTCNCQAGGPVVRDLRVTNGGAEIDVLRCEACAKIHTVDVGRLRAAGNPHVDSGRAA